MGGGEPRLLLCHHLEPESLFLFDLGLLSSPALGHQSSWFSGLGLRKLHQRSLDSQGLRLSLDYTTGPPGPPGCRWQIVGLLSLHS